MRMIRGEGLSFRQTEDTNCWQTAQKQQPTSMAILCPQQKQMLLSWQSLSRYIKHQPIMMIPHLQVSPPVIIYSIPLRCRLLISLIMKMLWWQTDLEMGSIWKILFPVAIPSLRVLRGVFLLSILHSVLHLILLMEPVHWYLDFLIS